MTDQLSYTYSATNQLQSIADNSGSNTGLVNGTTNYTYDGNGNMLTQGNTVNTQQNKTFVYNLLNLPQTVTLPTSTLTYTYDAAGNKLRRKSTGLNNTTDYISGIQYDGATTPAFSFVQTEEGKAVYQTSTGGFDYTYYLGDNLGNTRVTFDTQGGTANVLQKDDYYPFGMEINSQTTSPKNEYLYNKKEFQEEQQEYDYGARFYDPVIARWGVIDKFAGKYSSMTPYQYAALNPIKNIDVHGDSVKVNYNNQDILYENGKLYNKDGSEYKGAGTKLNKDGSVKRYKGFLGDAVGALNSLAKTQAGKDEVDALQASNNVFTIKDAKFNHGWNGFKQSDTRAAYAGESESQGADKFSTPFGGSGGTVYFNPNEGSVMEVGGDPGFRPISNLGHELFHAWDADRGMLNDALINGLEPSEWRASYYENQIRNQLGLPYRSEYNTKSGVVSILDSNGNPIPVQAPESVAPAL